MNLRVPTRGPLLVAGAFVGASAGAWLLAYPQAAPASALARALADLPAMATLGLAVVPALDTGRRRTEMAARAEPALLAAGAVWLLAELIRQVVVAAQALAVPVARLPASTVVNLTLHTAQGRAGIVSIATAALVFSVTLGYRMVPGRPAPVAIATAGLAAAGIAARAVSGHLAENVLGACAVAVHALAAALWCGVLAALLMTVDHRGQWARVLPRFSQLSLLCVAALLVSGAIDTLLVIDSPTQLFTRGYGRVLLAKVVLATVLVGVGWRNRSVWLPAAQAHRVPAAVSRQRAWTELALMVAALTLAAALVVTG